MNTRYITLSAGTSNVMTTSVTTMNFVETVSTLKAIKCSFERSRLVEGSFDKFHMK